MKTIETEGLLDVDGRVRRIDLRSDGSRWQVECWVKLPGEDEAFRHQWTKGGTQGADSVFVRFDEATARAEFEREAVA